MNLQIDGTWWLPEAPNHRVGGQLRLTGREFVLALDSRLSSQRPLESREVFQYVQVPAIHGNGRGGERITLVDVETWTAAIPVREETWHPTAALLGNHLVPPTGLRFTGVSIEIDFLDDWCEAPRLKVRFPSVPEPHVEVSVKPTVINTANLAIGKVELRSEICYQLEDRRAEITQACMFRVELDPPHRWDKARDKAVAPLTDLMTLITMRACTPRNTVLRPATATTERDPSVTLHLQLLNLDRDDRSNERLSPRDFLFTRRDLPEPFEVFLQRWLDARTRFAHVLQPMLAVDHAPFLYSETRFLNLTQAAETFHRIKIGGTPLTRDEHCRRVEEVSATAPGELRSWMREILDSANYLRFRERLEGLLDAADSVGAEIRRASPDFVRRVVKTRNFLTHRGRRSVLLGPVARHWHGTALQWLLRVLLMQQLGFEPDRALELVHRNSRYSYYLDSLKKSAANYDE